MRVSDIRKKYPEFFVTVEAAVWDDQKNAIPSPSQKMSLIMRRVAYKAAAVATLELHKLMVASRKKSKAPEKRVR